MRNLALNMILFLGALFTVPLTAQDMSYPIPGVPGAAPFNDPVAPPPPAPPSIPPYLYSISPVAVNAGEMVHISLSASSPSSPTLYYSFETQVPMPGAYISGSDFYWRATTPGVYRIRFIVSDGLWTDDEDTTITVY